MPRCCFECNSDAVERGLLLCSTCVAARCSCASNVWWRRTSHAKDGVCDWCAASKPGLLVCGRCRNARYCDANHQRLAWPTHKLICGGADNNTRHERAEVEAAISSLTSHAKHTGAALEACQALEMLLANGFKSTTDGGLISILAVLRTYGSTDPDITSTALHVLELLCKYDETCHLSIAQRDGIPLVILALGMHPASVAVTTSGCAVVAQLALNAANREALTTQGAIALLLQALHTHPTSVDICTHACHALSLLALHPRNQETIAALGGVAALLSAMNLHPTEPDVNDFASLALVNLITNNPRNLLACLQEGAGDAVRQLQLAFPTHPRIRNNGRVFEVLLGYRTSVDN